MTTICMEEAAFDDMIPTNEIFMGCRWWVIFCIKILLLISRGNETTEQMGRREVEYLVAIVGVWAVEELDPGV